MKYQHILSDKKTKCTICPRECLLQEGQSGFCHVRKNVNNEIILTSYGYNTGLSIDPIEKKPLYHFYPESKVLSFGTLGCNLGCQFCQNWHISRSKTQSDTLTKTSPKEIAQTAHKYNCKSVSFTYNEPTIFFEYAIDTAKECKKLGIKTVAVSNGYINPEPRKEFFANIDAVNIDLKAFNNIFYKKFCFGDLQYVLDTIKYIKQETDTHLELTTLLIEGKNDDNYELQKECEWIFTNLGNNVPLHFSAFYPCYKFTNKPYTSLNTLLNAFKIAKKVGLNYVYTGNIPNADTSTTYCKNCHKPLIKRNNYTIAECNLDEDGKCIFCKTKCDGQF